MIRFEVVGLDGDELYNLYCESCHQICDIVDWDCVVWLSRYDEKVLCRQCDDMRPEVHLPPGALCCELGETVFLKGLTRDEPLLRLFPANSCGRFSKLFYTCLVGGAA